MLRNEEEKKTLKDSLNLVSQAINEAVIDAGKKVDRSMTMVFVCIDLKTGEGAYLNAGHNCIFKLQDGGLDPILKPGLPLGFSAQSKFGTEMFKLAPGEGLFLYTDGLIENKGPDGSYFNPRKLRRVLQTPGSAEEIKSKILNAGNTIWKNEIPADDCAFIVIKRK